MGGKHIRVGDMSPESATHHRAAGAQRQHCIDRLAAAGQTSEARLSEAAMAHKNALNKTQRATVDGVTVWVPVGAKEQTVEEQELSMVAVARRAGRKSATAAHALRLAVDYKPPAAAADALALRAFKTVDQELQASLSQRVPALLYLHACDTFSCNTRQERAFMLYSYAVGCCSQLLLLCDAVCCCVATCIIVPSAPKQRLPQISTPAPDQPCCRSALLNDAPDVSWRLLRAAQALYLCGAVVVVLSVCEHVPEVVR
jgi:hypothetical protein